MKTARRTCRRTTDAGRFDRFPGAVMRAGSRLPLRELEPLAGAGPAVLLALHHARVASEKAGLLQRGAEVGVQLGERAADAVPDGACLAGEPAAADVHRDVHLAELLDHLERLLEDHLAGLAPEVIVQRAVVDDELARAGLQADARDRLLAAAGGGDEQLLGGHRVILRKTQN